MNFRNKRVGGLIQNELALLIAKSVEFDGALVTVTDVSVDAKLDNAVVLVSVIPEAKASEALMVLNSTRSSLQFDLARALHIKPMPRLSFEYDSGAGNAAAVEKVFLGHVE